MLKMDVPVVSQRTSCVVPMHPALGCTGRKNERMANVPAVN